MKPIENNIFLTGIPRAGTTLTTALLDSLENSVFLSEPYAHFVWGRNANNSSQLLKQIVHNFYDVRKKILYKKPILDRRNPDGTPLTNYFVRDENGRPVRSYRMKSYVFQVDNPNFLLGMKHCGLYTFLLPKLIKLKGFSVIAIIRHPVPTILSWRSLNLPISRGDLSQSRYWPELQKITRSNNSLLYKQVKIYDLFCKRYLKYRHKMIILKYENIVKNPSILETLTQRKFKRTIPTQNQNYSNHYDVTYVNKIKEYLKRYAPHAMKLYDIDTY